MYFVREFHKMAREYRKLHGFVLFTKWCHKMASSSSQNGLFTKWCKTITKYTALLPLYTKSLTSRQDKPDVYLRIPKSKRLSQSFTKWCKSITKYTASSFRRRDSQVDVGFVLTRDVRLFVYKGNKTVYFVQELLAHLSR